jgi:hypothetical protein
MVKEAMKKSKSIFDTLVYISKSFYILVAMLFTSLYLICAFLKKGCSYLDMNFLDLLKNSLKVFW